MYTITIASGKGGVGKTVIAVSLARTLVDSLMDSGGRRPSVLVLDLDLYARGLTYLMHPELDMFPRDFTSVEEMIQDSRIAVERLREAWQDSGSALIVVPASLRPGGQVPMKPAYPWEPGNVLESLEIVLASASDMGFDFAIIDTRAGPDFLSMSAATVADVTWLILEQDRISWRSSLNFVLQARSYQDHLPDKARVEARLRLDKAEFLFLPNKVTRYFRREAGDILGTYDFLRAIPLDTRFFEKYTLDPFEALSPEVLGETRFGESIAMIVQQWMELAGISEVYRFVPGPMVRRSTWERLTKLYASPERFLPFLAVYILAAKYVLLFLRFGVVGSELVTSALSDLLLVAILVLLAGRTRY